MSGGIRGTAGSIDTLGPSTGMDLLGRSTGAEIGVPGKEAMLRFFIGIFLELCQDPSEVEAWNVLGWKNLEVLVCKVCDLEALTKNRYVFVEHCKVLS